MSFRDIFSVVKGVESVHAKRLIAAGVKLLPGPPPGGSRWSDWTQVITSKKISALICPDAVVLTNDSWFLAQEIARPLDAYYLELRVQEGDHWDFTLFHRDDVVADFSTNVSYFESDPVARAPWKKGDAATFASLWNVPLERVEPYLIDWASLTAPCFVAEGDNYQTGDWCQVFDFMRAIGIDDPDSNPEHFELEVPAWKEAHVTQPRWRRIIRRISVWIKGTYPDVPRKTRQEREQWAKWRSSIRIEKYDLNGTDEVE